MSYLSVPLLAVFLLSACSGPALVQDEETDTPAADGGAVQDLAVTTTPTSVTRYETKDEAGNGYAQSITYNRTEDTFAVDNLAFDAGNSYTRSTIMPLIGGDTPAVDGAFKVYEGPATYPDSVTTTPIDQFLHRAIYAESTNQVEGKPRTSFAIVRTGSYIPYGFGGFLYQRNGSVTLPKTGQSNYVGQYAGLIDFNGEGGIMYSSADMSMKIDWEDFNEGAAIAGAVSNRKIYNMNGTEITASYLSALSTDLGYAVGTGLSALPTLHLEVTAGGLMNANGEFGTGVSSAVVDGSGKVVGHEAGSYYAVLAGDTTAGTDEVVGVLVVTSTTPTTGTVMRETGGFILYRN